MRYFPRIILFAAIVFTACQKTNNTTSSVLFYNATWSLPALTAAWNGGEIVTRAIAQGESSGTADSAYIQVAAGTNLITLKAGSNTLLDKNIYSQAATGNSFIVFDTGTATAPTRILQLTDDLTLPDTARIKYRILNMVPDTSVKVDIWLVKGVTDSVRLDSAGTFIGTTAAASNVQVFDTVTYRLGNYSLKVKKTLTQQVYVSVDIILSG